MAATMGAPGSVGGTTMSQVAPSVLLAEGTEGPLDAAVTAGVGAVAETILTNITRLYGTTRYFADDAMKVLVERSPALQAALEKYAAQVARAFTAACREMSQSWPNLARQARQAGKSPLDAVTAHFKTILSRNVSAIPQPSPGSEAYKVWKLFSGNTGFAHQQLLNAPVEAVRRAFENALWRSFGA